MTLTILQDGEKPLRQKSKRIAKIDDTVRNIAASMIEVMLQNNGVGLAGNQVGILRRIIIVLVNETPKVMINPEIIFESEEKVTEEEGCLSFAGQFYEIPRAKQVTVKYRNLSGHPILETHTGIIARCILHEIDHLDGITFKKYVSE
jgi:peptide deformylase